MRYVKSSLKKSFGVQCLTNMELETCLMEIEACVNSRPLTCVGDTCDYVTHLTQSHFLPGGCEGFVPDVGEMRFETITPVVLRDRHIVLQQCIDKCWSQWSTEYLPDLPFTVRTRKSQCNSQVASIVVVQDDNVPRLKWPLAVVLMVYPGKDGVVRSVILQTAIEHIERSVQLLHELEMCESDPCNSNVPQSEDSHNRSTLPVEKRTFCGFICCSNEEKKL